jgi:putative endonuclease
MSDAPSTYPAALRARRGARAYRSGAAAEDAVARHYLGSGHVIVARRWRGKAGEIDLIASRDGVTVFIEVKQARTHDAAAFRLAPRQMARLAGAAGEYLATRAEGLASPARFDLAMVDAEGAVAVIENVYLE